MTGILFLIPIALFMGLLGLGAFIWSVRSGQFDDPAGSANRILIDEDKPLYNDKSGNQSRKYAVLRRRSVAASSGVRFRK